MRHLTWILAVAVAAASCSSKRVHEEPVLGSGDRVSVEEAMPENGGGDAGDDSIRSEREDLLAAALADCEPAICEAIVRGEVALGMNERQVLAATRTTSSAWNVRRTGERVVLTPRSLVSPPSDDVADLAMVQIAADAVEAYSYQEPEGLRLVREPADATREGRAAARAERLVEEGDELAASGALDAALDRYDRADVLRPSDPMIDYKIATVLDKQLRPIQALIQYRLFLHQLELERIEARGDAAAKLADAIAQARQRIIILEREAR